jgi:hypothetical protein
MGEVYGLFQVPVVKQQAKNQDKIKKYLLEDIYPGEEKAKSNLIGADVYTDYEDKSNALDQNFLNPLYEENIMELLSDMQFSPDVNWHVNLDSWYNFSLKGGWQHVHDHVGGPLQIQWSGVHYAVFDKDHESTHFQNPQAAMIRSLWPTTNKNELPPYCDDLDIALKAQEGDIIWFPSYLNHYFKEQKSEKLRCTIAMNLTVFDHPILRRNNETQS